MKITINKKKDELVPFGKLVTGQPWITKEADLSVVKTLYVKTSKNRYASLDHDFQSTIDTKELVRPVLVKSMSVKKGAILKDRF